MNFLKKKHKGLLISDRTNDGSQVSLGSNLGKEKSGSSLKMEPTSEAEYTAVETIELKSKSSVKKNFNEGVKKHAHFFNENENLITGNDEELKTTQYSLDEVLPKQTNAPIIEKSTGANLLKNVYINEDVAGVTEKNSKHIMPLYACVIRGDKNELKKLINAHPDLLNLSDNFGRSPLMYCVLADRIDCAKVLLKMGCSIDQVDNAGRGALHLAAHKGSYKFVELLHSKGATLDMKDEDGQSPIHLSTRNRSAKCLEFLLRNIGSGMADVCDKQKRTALHWSAAFNNAECCRLLVKYGCNIAIPDDAGKTPLHWAANNQDPSAVNIMKILLNNVPSLLNWQDYEGRTALHFAVADGNDAAVEFLLNFEALECDVNRSDNTFRTQLHWAAQLGYVHVVKLLLQSGAKNSMTDSNGAQPLLYAALNNHADVVGSMIENDPTVVEQSDLQGRNSLMWASGKGSNDVIRVLLGLPAIDKTKADEPLRSNGNHELIAMETKQNHVKLDNAAVYPRRHPKNKFTPVDINRVDDKQNTALHFAAINGQASSVELLLSQGAQHNLRNDQNHTAIFGACEKGHLNAVKYLLDYSASITEVDVKKRSPLHWAALGGHDEVCELLIKEGLDVDIRDSMERTPLHCAAFGGFINCMNLLLEHGANVDAQDDQGLSALHWAADFGHIDAVRLLFQYNVFLNPMEYTEERLTPLDHALAGDHDEIIQYLIEKNALSAEAIRVYAAKRIQACYRGYQVRKTFLKQKQILLQHKNQMLKREQKKDRSKIQKQKKTTYYETLEKTLVNSSLLSMATSTDGPESSVQHKHDRAVVIPMNNHDTSRLLENLSDYDKLFNKKSDSIFNSTTTTTNTPIYSDPHREVFESLKGWKDGNLLEMKNNDTTAIKFENSIRSNAIAIDNSRLNTTKKSRIKDSKVSKTTKSSMAMVQTNNFPDIGDVDYITSEVSSGLSYKGAINRGVDHLPNNISTCTTGDVIRRDLSLALYIESLIQLSDVNRQVLIKIQREREKAFIIANESATIIQSRWRGHRKKKTSSHNNNNKQSQHKAKEKKVAGTLEGDNNLNETIAFVEVKKKPKKEKPFSRVTSHESRPKSHKEASKSTRFFDDGRGKRVSSARVLPQALTTTNLTRNRKTNVGKEKHREIYLVGRKHKIFYMKSHKIANKNITDLPLKWQHIYSDMQSEKSTQTLRKASAKFSYNLGKKS